MPYLDRPLCGKSFMDGAYGAQRCTRVEGHRGLCSCPGGTRDRLARLLEAQTRMREHGTRKRLHNQRLHDGGC